MFRITWIWKRGYITKTLLFFSSSYLTRVIYKALFNNYADQNDLFNLQPNMDSVSNVLVKNFNISVCDRINCIPALFYDFYTLTNYTLAQARQAFLSQIRLAWTIQNFKQMDYTFQSLIYTDIYSIIPSVSPTNP